MDVQMGQYAATGQAEAGQGSLLDRLADRLGAHITARTVFGEPVERDGVTVIPVAKARMGFGGGEGTAPAKDGGSQGTGGGAGLIVVPLGYIEIKGGASSFRSIADPATRLAVILAGGWAALVVLRGLRKLVR